MKRFKQAVMDAIHGFFNQSNEDGRILSQRLQDHVESHLDCNMIGWVSVKDALPEIPEGRYGVPVLIATFDRVFEEMVIEDGGPAGRGYSVSSASYGTTRNRDGQMLDMFEGSEKEFDFKELYIGGEHGSEWGPTGDPVRFWMYMPEPPVHIKW